MKGRGFTKQSFMWDKGWVETGERVWGKKIKKKREKGPKTGNLGGNFKKISLKTRAEGGDRTTGRQGLKKTKNQWSGVR